MKYSDLQYCIKTIEDNCRLSGMRVADGDFSLLNFQRGANAPLEQKVRVVLDFDDCEMAIEVVPKRSRPE